MIGLPKTPPQRHGPSAILLYSLLLLVSFCFVQAAYAGMPPQNGAETPVAHGPQFAISDFDGDGRPDLATVAFGRSGPQNYAINFRLTSGLRQSIDIAAPEGGVQLRTSDVNGDNFPDVVVTTLWTGRPVAVLLNDGRGNFTRSEPTAFPGVFETSQNSLASGDGAKTEAAAALLSRHSPDPCQERNAGTSPIKAVERIAARHFHFVLLPICRSCVGRAPPSVVVHL